MVRAYAIFVLIVVLGLIVYYEDWVTRRFNYFRQTLRTPKRFVALDSRHSPMSVHQAAFSVGQLLRSHFKHKNDTVSLRKIDAILSILDPAVYLWRTGEWDRCVDDVVCTWEGEDPITENDQLMDQFRTFVGYNLYEGFDACGSKEEFMALVALCEQQGIAIPDAGHVTFDCEA